MFKKTLVLIMVLSIAAAAFAGCGKRTRALRNNIGVKNLSSDSKNKRKQNVGKIPTKDEAKNMTDEQLLQMALEGEESITLDDTSDLTGSLDDIDKALSEEDYSKEIPNN